MTSCCFFNLKSEIKKSEILFNAIVNNAMAQDADCPKPAAEASLLYCPTCARKVEDPLVCGDCSAVICRACGTPLESADELAMG
jgi:hypothetical protein